MLQFVGSSVIFLEMLMEGFFALNMFEVPYVLCAGELMYWAMVLTLYSFFHIICQQQRQPVARKNNTSK